MGQGKGADAPKGALLSVKGEGSAEVKPDYAVVKVLVTTSASTLEEAADAHGERATRAVALIESLKADGVQLQKSEFALHDATPRPLSVPAGSPPPAPPEPLFNAQTTITIKIVPLAGLNKAVSTLAGSGVLQVRSVRFDVERERAALNEARRSAMQDAREQAEVYASAGNFRLVGISEMTDGEARPAEETGEFDLPAPRSVQIIPPAVLYYRASVDVTWRVAPR